MKSRPEKSEALTAATDRASSEESQTTTKGTIVNNSTLIPVFSGTLANSMVQLCDARTLHAFMQVKRDFTTWIKSRIRKFGFTAGEDFLAVENLSSPDLVSAKSRAQKLSDYHLTLDMAKELAMVENNEQGRAARRYFIACERKAMEAAAKPEQMRLDYDRISPAQAQDLKEIVQAIVKEGVQGYGETWSRLQRKFKVNSYLELPATRHLEAREYLIAKLPKGSNETVVEEAPKPKPTLDDAVRLDMAFALASQTAAKVQRAVFAGVMSGNADWKNSRYLVKLEAEDREGDVTVNAKKIERNACVLPIDRFHDAIEDSVAVDAQTLAQLASTCMNRLGRMAQRAAIGN